MCDPKDLKKTLRKQVIDHDCAAALGKTDRSQWTMNEQPRTVFRGQPGPLKSTQSFFSTSVSQDVAKEEFGGTVQKIKVLPGVRILDVNAILGDTRMADEKEIIVDGGGTFTECVKIKEGLYSTTYGPAVSKPSPPPPPPPDVDFSDIDNDPEFLRMVAEAEARQNGSRRTRRAKRRQNAVRPSSRTRKARSRRR